jgi:hypothetical protein
MHEMLRRLFGLSDTRELDELRAELADQAREIVRLRERLVLLEMRREALRIVQGCEA